MRICYADLETTNLKGDVGRLLVGSILDRDTGEITTFRRDSYKRRKAGEDVAIARDIRDKLEEYHLVVGWFWKGFDSAFLSTRLVEAGERPIARRFVLDPLWFCKGWRGLSTRNAKLGTLAEFFNLEEQKMPVPVSVWAAAAEGDRTSMDILVERCESDCRVLRSITDRLLDAGLVTKVQLYP